MSRVLMCGNIAHVRSAADDSADLKIVRKTVISTFQISFFSGLQAPVSGEQKPLSAGSPPTALTAA